MPLNDTTVATESRLAGSTRNGNDRHTSNGDGRPRSPDGVLNERAEILGCQIDRLDLGQVVKFCEQVIESRGSAQHMAVNVAKLVAMRTDEHLRDAVNRCELITADGQPVVWASRLLRDPLPSRVAGIDLMHGLLARAVVKGYRIYVLGARPEILEHAVERMRGEYPGVSLVGYRDGYYHDSEEAAVAASVAAARPDILFVAMSSPRKEYFLARYREMMGVPLVMGVGGAIDVVSGVRRRAPVLLQRIGLEWLFRLVQEPRRLARRYLTTNARFILLLSREVVHARITRKLSSGSAAGSDTAPPP